MKFVVTTEMLKPKVKTKTKKPILRRIVFKIYEILKDQIEYTLTEAWKVTGVLALGQIANRALHPLER